MNSGQKEKITALAVANLGKPYKYGSKPDEAPNIFDCSSFVQYIYKNIGIAMPRTALEQAHMGKKISPKNPLKTGDIIFFKGTVGRYDKRYPIGIGHVAIYIGEGKAAHARYKKSDGGKVESASILKLLKRKDLVIIKRII
jgi:peptidoglycan endopeptidase LytE